MSKSFLQANAPVATQASTTSGTVVVLAAASSFLYGRGASEAGATAYSMLVSNVSAATFHWSFTSGQTGHPVEPNQSVWLTVEPDATVHISNTNAAATIAYVYSLWI
jgi:hypothetical protein